MIESFIVLGLLFLFLLGVLVFLIMEDLHKPVKETLKVTSRQKAIEQRLFLALSCAMPYYFVTDFVKLPKIGFSDPEIAEFISELEKSFIKVWDARKDPCTGYIYLQVTRKYRNNPIIIHLLPLEENKA